MKQLIIDKIDRLIEQGYQVEKTNKGFILDEIVASCNTDYYQNSYYVRQTDLENEDSKVIYEYLKSQWKKQFEEYLKGD